MRGSYSWIKHLNNNFWERVVRSTYLDLPSLSIFRIVAGIFLLASHMPSYGWIASVPKTFFSPPVFSIANMFHTFPGDTFFFILDCLILASLAFVTLGIKARVSSFIFFACCLTGLSFQYSFGKISHVILAFMLFGCMAFSGWGRHLALWPDKATKTDDPAKCLSLFSVLICFGMFSAGFEKAFVWLDFDLSFNGFLAWSQDTIVNSKMHYLLAPYVKYFPHLMLELFDYTAVIFELSPLLFLLHSKRGWRLWLLVASIFHLANALLLNIPFPLHSIVYLVFIDFSWLHDKIKSRLINPRFRYGAIASVVLVALVRLVQIMIGQNIISAFFSIEGAALLNLYLSIMIWCIVIFLIARSVLSESFSKGHQEPAKTYG